LLSLFKTKAGRPGGINSSFVYFKSMYSSFLHFSVLVSTTLLAGTSSKHDHVTAFPFSEESHVVPEQDSIASLNDYRLDSPLLPLQPEQEEPGAEWIFSGEDFTPFEPVALQPTVDFLASSLDPNPNPNPNPDPDFGWNDWFSEPSSNQIGLTLLPPDQGGENALLNGLDPYDAGTEVAEEMDMDGYFCTSTTGVYVTPLCCSIHTNLGHQKGQTFTTVKNCQSSMYKIFFHSFFPLVPVIWG
jgi:hypothetical protein